MRRSTRPFFGIGEAGQQAIASKRVTLFGCGALGSHLAQHLVRAGVGAVRICDRDCVELEHLERQVLFDHDDVRACIPKAIAAANKLARVNPRVTIEPRVVDITHANVEDQIADADLVLDATDNLDARFLINEACVKVNKPWIYGGVVGSTGMLFLIDPGRTACFACMLPDEPERVAEQMHDTSGVLSPAVSLVAALQSAEALKLLAEKLPALNGYLTTIDVWTNEYRSFNLERDPDCSVCVRRQMPFLGARSDTTAASLSGHNSVQISPPAGRSLDLGDLERRLARVSTLVKRNAFLLRAYLEGCEATVFPDGRAIVKGTEDLVRARRLYSRYIEASATSTPSPVGFDDAGSDLN